MIWEHLQAQISGLILTILKKEQQRDAAVRLKLGIWCPNRADVIAAKTSMTTKQTSAYLGIGQVCCIA